MFRVGRADELATTSGLTHLVEHLALPAQSRRRVDFNGVVDNVLASFWASGDEELARTFLAETARSLRSLPLERLDTERQILLAEEATQGPNLTRFAFALRYGPAGHGLTGYDEWGLRRVTAENVAGWATERFNSSNAALWLSGPEPGVLELSLPEGSRFPAPAAHTIAEVAEAAPSVYGTGPDGAVAFSLESDRSIAFRVGLNVLGHRVQDRLRFELGLSYEVEIVFIPLSAERVHVVLVTDASEHNVRRVSEEILRALEDLSADGPTAEELEHELEDARRYSSDASESPSQLYYAAAQSLLGAPHVDGRDLLAEQERATAADVARTIAEARRTLIAIVPDAQLDLPGLRRYPLAAATSLDGRTYRPRGLRLRRAGEPRLVVGGEGVMLEAGEVRSTVPYRRCVAALRYPDGTRSLVSEDGFFVVVEPGLWKQGTRAVAEIDAATPDHLVVRMEPALMDRVEALEEVAAEKLKRRWPVTDELELLPARLEPDEEIVTLAEAAKGVRSGLLVLTDRRVIFFTQILRETWVEFGFDAIDAVEGKPGLMDSKLSIKSGGETTTFAGVTPKERAAEIAREIEARRR